MLRRTSLHHGWQFAESSWQARGKLGFSLLEWLPARVPGHVHLDLIDNGIIAHPFERMYEIGCQWVDERDWSYRTCFEWQADSALPKRVLRFEGLDTICQVSLNGELLAEHDNMFVPLEIDVSSRLKPGKNELRVDFASALRVGLERRAEWLSEQGLDGCEFERLLERSFVRKVQCMYGWDWGPRLVSCGIWRPVELLEYAARLTDVCALQQHLPDGRVRLQITSSVHGDARVVHALEGVGELAGDGEILIEDPELWYPAGLGEPALYVLTSRALAPGNELAHDERTTRIGLRTIRLRREADHHGESFEFEINGQRLWAMGANFIPDHAFPSQIGAGQYRSRLEAARAAGMNMLRVWGGGLYETDEFYDLCDELGLLVWQDFAFACAYYPDTGHWRDVVRREAEENVRRLRRHPSLALWCGNNENLMMWQQRWGDKTKQPPRYFGEELYDRVLPEVVRALDPGRPYIPSSPFGGDDANGGGQGDQHYWDVWHGRGDWVHYKDSTARFASEYGFASAPSVRAWREVLGPGPLCDAVDPIVRWHDKTMKGYETFRGLVFRHYPETSELEAWIYYSQLNQRDAMRAALEHYRTSDFCRGSLIWQLNDCWPVQSWALIDSHGQPKPAWFELSRLHAPLLIALRQEDSAVECWAAYDNAPAGVRLEGEVVLRASELATGALLGRWTAPISLKSGERRSILRVDASGLAGQSTLLSAQLGGAGATLLLSEPRSLELAAPAELVISLMDDAELRLTSPTPVVDLWLWDDEGSAPFVENALTLSEPGLLRVGYHGSGRGLRARSLAGEHPLSLTRARLA